MKLKSIEKLIFLAFGKILVLANAFFYSNSNSKKVLKIDYFQLLARFWFWRMVFSIQILIKKVWKIDFSSFWQALGFGECFFLFKF